MSDFDMDTELRDEDFNYYCGEAGCNTRRKYEPRGAYSMRSHYREKHGNLEFDKTRLVPSRDPNLKCGRMSPFRLVAERRNQVDDQNDRTGLLDEANTHFDAGNRGAGDETRRQNRVNDQAQSALDNERDIIMVRQPSNAAMTPPMVRNNEDPNSGVLPPNQELLLQQQLQLPHMSTQPRPNIQLLQPLPWARNVPFQVRLPLHLSHQQLERVIHNNMDQLENRERQLDQIMVETSVLQGTATAQHELRQQIFLAQQLQELIQKLESQIGYFGVDAGRFINPLPPTQMFSHEAVMIYGGAISYLYVSFDRVDYTGQPIPPRRLSFIRKCLHYEAILLVVNMISTIGLATQNGVNNERQRRGLPLLPQLFRPS